MKLKTLKDMIIPRFKWEFVDRTKLCSRIELRREAIKHIISIGEERAIIEKLKDKEMKKVMRYHKVQLQCWIMDFFNITEEDLK